MKLNEIIFRAKVGDRYIYSITDDGKSRLGWFFSNVKSDNYEQGELVNGKYIFGNCCSSKTTVNVSVSAASISYIGEGMNILEEA